MNRSFESSEFIKAIDENRVGRLVLDSELVFSPELTEGGSKTQIYPKILSEIWPIEMDHSPVRHSYEIICFSPHFKRQAPSIVAPEYYAVFQTGYELDDEGKEQKVHTFEGFTRDINEGDPL